VNILQLCAGKGSRFAKYTNIPKPFINVNGVPLFKAGLESIKIDWRTHCLFQEEHIKKYNPSQYVDAIIHSIDGYTDGAASSAYYVISQSEYRSEPWLIIDCDFILEYNPSDFLKKSTEHSVIMVEKYPYDLKSSYTCVDSDMNVYGVAEKQVISKYRNTGHYHFQSGDIFCEAYKFYKDNNILSSGEFYISPLYNYLIQNGHSVKASEVDKYISLGIPEELEKYLND
jgi:NDP-sugar pyrophosphorylase family protein